jgi:transposase
MWMKSALGCIPEFLPTYSPDLNPIEHSWPQIKSIRSKFRYAVDALFVSPHFKNLFMVR